MAVRPSGNVALMDRPRPLARVSISSSAGQIVKSAFTTHEEI